VSETTEIAIREAKGALLTATDNGLTDYCEFSSGDDGAIEATVFNEDGDEIAVVGLRIVVV
jgi:hypothetical protein